tara:strand:+ start:3279 stop:4178 length:900 start_codon:yes stop_codon:yes gene_type:complete
MKLHKYENTLFKIVQNNKKVIVCTAETRWAMRNLPNLIGDKFFDVGIAEQTLIGSIAGMSKMGMVPIAHALASFLLYRPYEFIRTDLGIPNLPSILVGSFNGFISQANGPTHQAVDDISLMWQVPNMRILAPSNLDEMCKLTELAVKNIDSPTYLRFNDIEDPDSNSVDIEWCENQIVSEGSETIVISYGLCFNILKKVFMENYSDIGLANCIFIKPIIIEFFENIFSNYNKIIVVEDHKYQGSLCFELKHLAYELNYSGKIFGINLEDRFFKPGMLSDVLESEGFSENKLKERIDDLL